ncbi:hypothetical protein BFG60_3275 [Microcystis aeruginosa NIES-98]|nr:hypothetical protein BFG60_3275 [Microcystis aeruginosa NIES-98]
MFYLFSPHPTPHSPLPTSHSPLPHFPTPPTPSTVVKCAMAQNIRDRSTPP